jgi:serine/threonine protein kinase
VVKIKTKHQILTLLQIRAAGEVFEATDIKTGKKVAIKKMQLTQDILKMLPAEISTMQKCKHDSIIDYCGSYLVGNDQVWVVMELMTGGCLTDIITDESIKMSENSIGQVVKQVLFFFFFFFVVLRWYFYLEVVMMMMRRRRRMSYIT